MTTASRRVVEGPALGKHAFALSLLDCMPSLLLDRLLFRPTAICLQLQKAVQRLLGGPSSVLVQFKEGPLRDELFECFTSEKYFLLGTNFEHPTQVLLQGLVKPGDIVYDVGAHAGYMTLLLSALCEPGGHVFAFEPSPINFSRLKRNMELNKASHPTLVNRAVSDHEGFAFLAETGTACRLVDECTRPAAEYSRVLTIRLDDFVYRNGYPSPKIFKIDVEGHAGSCLRGAQVILQKERPSLICEIHHRGEFESIRQALAPHTYRIAEVESILRFPRHIVATPV
jgi:FkbM family methyltransferase